MTNGEGGLVLTIIDRPSPARMLVCEQYPSIHGQRYLVGGSTRVLERSQSDVPGFSFSAAIKSRWGGEDIPRSSAGLANADARPAAAAPLSRSRRFGMGRECFSLIL